MMKTNNNSRALLFLLYSILAVFAVISLMPLYWVYTTAIQLPTEVMVMPPKFVPSLVSEFIPLLLQGDTVRLSELATGSFENLDTLFNSTRMIRWFINSLIIGVSVTFGILLLDSMAAFSFAKKEFPGR